MATVSRATYSSNITFKHRLSASVYGQTIVDFLTHGNLDIEYANGGGHLGTPASWGKCMSHLGSAIGNSNHTFSDVCFTFPSVPSILRHRVATELDAALEGVKLVVIDAEAWLQSTQFTDSYKKCQHCKTGDMSSKGWLDNASSSKGVGKYHTIYTASKNRQCSSCKMHTSDISILSKFPPLLNSMVPVVKSPSSGLPTWLLKLLLHMVPEGVTFSHISRAANSLLQTLNAEQRLACYQALQKISRQKGQVDFLYPELKSAETKIHGPFLREMYLSCVQDLLSSHRKLQGSWSHWILKLDGGFKVERRGMITAMDGMGRILRSWMGGASYWDIAHHLTALALRCRHFGNKVILTYVDNPASCCHVLPRCFPDLGTGLYPGDKGIRGDMNHLCALINDQNNTNHPGLALAIKEFRDSIHIVHKEDVGKPAELQRKLRPPPHAMLKIFLDWVKKYLKHGQDARTGEHMFTAEGVRLFHRTMKQICKWYFSDPWYMDGGRCVPLDLYIRGSNDSLISFKETSIIEAGHSVSNRVRASVGGENVTDTLAATVMEHCNMVWNMRRCTETLKVMQTNDVMDLQLLSDVNAAQKALAGIAAAPFANVPDLETIPENPYQEEEGQGYTTACVLSSQAAAADDLPSSSQRRAAGEVASDAIIKRVAASVEKALREGAVNMQPVFEQVPPPFVNDCPINWALLTPLGLEQPTPDDPRIQPSAWCTPEFMWAFNTGSSRRPCVEEVEEDVDAENGKRLEIELAHLLKGNTLIAAPNAQDTVVAAEALLQMQTSSPGAGSSKEKRLAVVKKVSSPPVATMIKKRGASRLKGRFINAHAGGIPNLLPCTNLPITTEAERNLFFELLPQFSSKKGRVDYKGMVAAFNARFYSQVMPGKPGINISGTESNNFVFSKSVKNLKDYYKQFDHNLRTRENNAFNMAISLSPLPHVPATPDQGIHTQSTLHETFKRAAVVSGANKRSVVSPVSSPSKLSMPSPSNLNKGCKQQRLVCDELEPGCSNSTVQNTSGTTPMKQVFNSAMQWVVQGLFQSSNISKEVALPQEGAVEEVQQHEDKLVTASVKNTEMQLGGQGRKDEPKQLLCAACLLIGNQVLLKREHPAGGCRYKANKKEKTELLHVAMQKMHQKKMVKKVDKHEDFSGPTYLEYLYMHDLERYKRLQWSQLTLSKKRI